MRAAGLALGISTAACAQILSYDDYRGRDASLVVVDTAVSDASLDIEIADADAGAPPARVPTRPPGATTPSGGKQLYFAASRYSYGLSDRAGMDSETAWAGYGYDLDAVCTYQRDSVENTNTCRRPPGAGQESLIDGERCRDNNFGRHLSILLRATLPAVESTLNGLIRSGSTTWLLRIDDVGAGADDPYAPGYFYRSSDDRMTSPPKWDGNDERAVQADSLTDGDLNRPVIAFPRGYIRDGVWVSGEPAPLAVIAPLTAVGFFPLPLEHGFVTLDLERGHGLLVGVMPAARLEESFLPIADFAIVCPGTTLYTQTLANMRKTPDVVVGAPGLQDLDRTCDGVSTAVAFNVTAIKPLTRVVPASPPRKPRCGDAG